MSEKGEREAVIREQRDRGKLIAPTWDDVDVLLDELDATRKVIREARPFVEGALNWAGDNSILSKQLARIDAALSEGEGCTNPREEYDTEIRYRR